jgi:ArsR family transcriptional regulator, arsenate/arsenite/antimonite-responsive transcriptional repressor
MAFPRNEQFTESQLALADVAKALAHPARIAILDVLARRSDCICGDLVEELPLAQATVSQHLKVLKEAGLIHGTIEGPRTCYCIDAVNLKKAEEHFSTWYKSLSCSETCC